MAADPIGTGFSLLYQTLAGDATLMALITGVYQVMAPAAATPDYCLLINQSARDTNSAAGGYRQLSLLLFQVKIVGPVQDEANLRTAYARVDALLQPGGGALTNTLGTLACFREESLSIGEIVNGTLWLNIGGLYRVEV